MNRRAWLTSLLALPLVPAMFRAAQRPVNTSGYIQTEVPSVREFAPKGYIELKGDATGGIEFILHEQAAAGYSFRHDDIRGAHQYE